MTDPWPYAHQTELAKKAEAFETPEWCVEAILDREILSSPVLDPCCGRGVMAAAAHKRKYFMIALDLHDWGFGYINVDYLALDQTHWIFTERDFKEHDGFSVFMNPPFSLAEKFVEHSKALGARKIVCFQRFAWWESQRRSEFWTKHPPNRIYVCAKRASCWRIDIPPEKRTSGTPTAHAFFVWEAGHPGGSLVGRLS